MNRSLLGVVATLLLVLASTATVAAAPLGSPVLVDRPPGFGALPFDGVNTATVTTQPVSADGRYVVFDSTSNVLLDGDEDAAPNVYRLDRQTGTVAQVNTSATGGQPSPFAFSGRGSISADGRYVAFVSAARTLVPDGPAAGVYVKDMETGAIELVSRSTGADGAPAANVFVAAISGDGRHVAFHAQGPVRADNATGGTAFETYVRNLDTNTTHMVSVTATGAPSNRSATGAPSIDFKGDAVAFVTDAALDPSETVLDPDVYSRTGIGTANERTNFVSFTAGQTGGATDVRDAAISGDGSLVAWSATFGGVFMSNSTAPVAPAKRLAVARPGGGGSTGDQVAFEPVAAATAVPKRATFHSFDKLDPADTNGMGDLYAAEVAHPGDGNFVHLETSGAADGQVTVGASALDGGVVVFAAAARNLSGGDGVRGQVYVRAGGSDVLGSQPPGAAPRTLEAGSSSVETMRAFSDDGRLVVFNSNAPALGATFPREDAGTNEFQSQTLVRDLVTGTTTNVSVSPDGKPSDRSSGRVQLDAAGHKVMFISQASNLVPGVGANRSNHLYVRDLRTDTTTVVDRNDAGGALQQGISDARFSADGSHVVYSTNSPDAPGAPPPTDRNTHVYVVDLGTGTTVLADRATGDGPVGNQSAFRVEIDGNGSRVAFVSSATNLGAGDPGGKRAIFVRDLDAKTTTWASTPEDANPTHANADSPVFTRDGTQVAFQQSDPAFGNGMGGGSQIFVRDLAAKTTRRVSPDVAGPTSFAFNPSISGDGALVAFTAIPSTTTFFDSQAYVTDLSTGATDLVSTGADGATRARLGGTSAALSGNGACVAFTSQSDDISDYRPDFNHVYVRALSPSCPALPAATPPPPGGGGGPGPGPTTTPPPPDTRDRTAPRISRASMSRRRFAVGTGSKRGTTFTFTLSERAAATIAITQRLDGRRSGKKCVAPTRKLAKAKKCTRVVTRLTLSRTGLRTGANRIAFTGRSGKTTLKPGAYQAQLVARDAAGNRSKPTTLTFAVTRN